MQLNMKTLNIVVLLFVTLSSCGQTVSNDKQQTANKPTSQEALAVYQKMTGEICNCTSSTMKHNKPSTSLDSCYKVVLDKYTDSLKVLGYDPTSSVGQNKLSNEIRLYLCRDMYSLLQKEWADEDAKKLLFKGTIVSQKQLPGGEIEIVMADAKTKERKTFKSTSFLSDPAQTNKKLLEYEMTIEYEIRHNSKTKQDEFYIKEDGKNMTIGVEKVGN
jgi:hypothetical protein